MIPNQQAPTVEMMQERKPPSYQNGSQGLYSILGAEMERKRKIKEIRQRLGVPDPRQQMRKMPTMQWMGDNQT